MYFNPVKVIETSNWVKAVSRNLAELGVKNPLITTSPEIMQLQDIFSVFKQNLIYSNIGSNPTFESCKQAIDFSNKEEFDGIIAIGGGSVMDTAKTVMAALGTGVNDIKDLIKNDTPYKNRVPAIFIPTTHGTGSEVTMWGTIWNIKEKKKHSISHPDLYPDIAILDGSLTLNLPLDISLITVLDALSHSFEAIWNKNANPTSTDYAIKAICMILKNIENLKGNLSDLEVRFKLLKASNSAGLAFSNTKTAAAHSISYPLTSHFGIPHGIASSISLIPLLNINSKKLMKPLSYITTVPL